MEDKRELQLEGKKGGGKRTNREKKRARAQEREERQRQRENTHSRQKTQNGQQALKEQDKDLTLEPL
jgi:hypothetical protein